MVIILKKNEMSILCEVMYQWYTIGSAWGLTYFNQRQDMVNEKINEACVLTLELSTYMYIFTKILRLRALCG